MAGRTNNAFNVADFGEQGSNGWFYRYGKATKPTQSRQIETQISGSYKVSGLDGLEIKSDFVHTANGVAPILEWRAAEDGAVNVAVTYVKDVNGDSNPSYPDGVKVYVYKGEELLDSHQVEVYTDKQTLLETGVKDLEIKKGESLYFAVDPNTNNAYDGGLLYIAVNDVNTPAPTARTDERVSNDANNQADYGYQGKNGWTYMYGKSVTDCHLVSTETDDGYMNVTSPALVIKGDFIHPAINDKAILCWTPALSGPIEVRGKYTKFEQNDGNPDWPDGVTVEIYLNDKKLFEQEVPAPAEGTETIEFRQTGLNVTPEDRLYFTVSANGNSSYDGGCFDITVLDRIGRFSENSVAIDESEIRQNIADVQFDFGPQGNNGWFFQEGYKDEPFGALNVYNYLPDDKYYDSHYLEIKRDYANVGENGRSVVIKWKVAQDGVIRIDANYTKAPNQDKNPDWPDGTRVTMWHNHTRLISQYFAPLATEVTKDLSVESLEVKRGDYITMTINGLENNAYDGGNFHFAIMSLSGLVGPTENDVTIPDNDTRTNNADVNEDFGAQGTNGWFFQYGYNTDPFFAINVERYNEGESYTTQDGIEIKRDYIMPSTKGKCAQVKWQVAQDGKVNVLADYTKLLNEDANPSWPDGVTVTLLYGNTVLKQEYFAPDTANEITKDLSVMGLDVKKGEYITLIVDGGENTAYDGGLYHFMIEDANFTKPAYTPDSDNNADLAADFDKSGTGWYYTEGRTPDQANELTVRIEGGYGSVSQTDLQVKDNFVQPGKNKAAMYQWVAGADGTIDVVGSYTKFGHEDKNPDWPDGTHVTVYLNGTELLSEDVAVKAGDGNDTVLPIDLAGLAVNRGDILTFMVSAKDNASYDGGRMSVQIYPHAEPLDYVPGAGSSNNTGLAASFGEQGSDGWYYGYSVNGDGTDFAPAQLNGDGDTYKSAKYDGLQLKENGVEPDAGAAAVYRWVAAKDTQIWLDGQYVKGAFSEGQSDGVHVAVYLNGKLVPGMEYDVTKSGEVVSIKNGPLAVKAGDILDFVITAGDSGGYDYGEFSMSITDHEVVEPAEPELKNDATENIKTTLSTDFSSAQGTNGWYYGVCDWDGQNFSAKYMKYSADDGGKWRYNDGKPDLRKDFVEPGGGKSAAYLWVAAQDGEIKITGSYTKYPNTDDPNADGVAFRLFKNPGDSNVILYADEGIKGSVGSDGVVKIDKTITVVKGDKIIFAVDPEGNDSYDSGKLDVTIEPAGEAEEPKPTEPEYKNESGTNETTLASGFSGTQGNNGWYYGVSDYNGANFKSAAMVYTQNSEGFYQWLYNGTEKPDLRSSFVEPGEGKCAAYMWVAAQEGYINITGSYTKNENTDPNGNGVSFRIAKNAEGMEKPEELMYFRGGLPDNAEGTYSQLVKNFADESKLQKVHVNKGDQILFVVDPQGNNSFDSGTLDVTITDCTPKLLTNLARDFSGIQGENGWSYGLSNWDGSKTDFSVSTGSMQYSDADNNPRWQYNEGNPELKSNWVHPGVDDDHSAVYKWVSNVTGQITIVGSYTKEAYEDTNGVWFRIWKGNAGDNEQLAELVTSGSVPIKNKEKSVGPMLLTVEQNDEILFVISPEGNNTHDGGTLAVSIYEGDVTGFDIPVPTTIAAPVMMAIAPVPAVPEAPVVAEYVNNGEDNSASLAENFSGDQGDIGWYYGASRADGKDFAPLGYDAAQAAYIGADGQKLSANGVRPGADGSASAAYLWVAAADGQISLKGSYAVNPDQEGGASLRVFHGEEELLSQYAPAGGEVSLDKTLTVAAGDQLLFVVSPEGESAVDGVLQVAIAPIVPEPEEVPEDADKAEEPEDAEPGEKPEEPAGDEPVEVPGLEEPGDAPDAEEKDKAPDGDAQGDAPETDPADEPESEEPKDGQLNGDPAQSEEKSEEKSEEGSKEEPKDEVKDEVKDEPEDETGEEPEEKAKGETKSEAQDGEQEPKAEDGPDKTPEPPASPAAKPSPEPAAEPKEPEPLPESGEGEPEPQVKE